MNTAALRAIRLKTVRTPFVNILTDVDLPAEGEGVRDKADYKRMDKANDSEFYKRPRMDPHMSSEMLEALAGYYGGALGGVGGGSARHLDLCASFSCHFPESYAPAECVGVGMNQEELEANPALTRRIVQNLNKERTLDLPDGYFTAATNVASIEYLTHPLQITTEVKRVLAPGAPYIISFTSRAFWTKATHIWVSLTHEQRMVLVASYLSASGFKDIEAVHLTPLTDGDEPLAAVVGRA